MYAVWGGDAWLILEKIHLRVCRFVFGAKSCTCLVTIYFKLGKVTRQTLRHVEIVKFYERMSRMKSQKYAKKAFERNSNDAKSGVNDWVSTAE